MSEQKSAFISGALSGTSIKVMLEVFYERIGAECDKKNINAYIPHRNASSKIIPDLTPRKLYEMNMKKIEEVDLLIAYAGQPSVGMGMEIQQAAVKGKDIIVLFEKEALKSRPLLGCTAVIDFIYFEDFDDAIEQLGKALDRWLAKE